jgi:polyferredoxin
MSRARRIIVYFNARPLANRTVYLHLPNGRLISRVTDDHGIIPNLSLRDIRGGLAVEYSPNIRNTYIQKYMPQRAQMISPAIVPLAILLGLTVLTIILCIIFRYLFSGASPPNPHELFEKSSTKTLTKTAHMRGFKAKFGSRLFKARPAKQVPRMRQAARPAREASVRGGRGVGRSPTVFRVKSKFMMIRWCVMIFSFVALTWGGSILGVWFEEVTIPVFACGRNNEEQLVGSVCYYMSHLNVLFTLPWQTIVMFFAGLVVPLVLFGRLLCGFVCPMGLVQDTLHVTRQTARIKGIPLTEKLFGKLAIIKWTFVMLFFGMAFVGLDFCMVCPVGAFSPALAGFRFSLYIGGFIALFVLVGSFFKHRFFCTICPLGLVMGLFHKISFVRLKKDCTACTECGGCYEACPMGIKTIYTEREKTDVTTINCIMCGECIRHCPEDNALSITVCGKKIYTAKRETFMKKYRGCGGCKK